MRKLILLTIPFLFIISCDKKLSEKEVKQKKTTENYVNKLINERQERGDKARVF